MAKIKKEQLKKIQEQQKAINEVLAKVGYISAQKHALLHELAGLNQDVEETKAQLEEEYGAVNIDMSTGEYKEIEKEEKDV